MKALIASVFALGLLGASVAPADALIIRVGPGHHWGHHWEHRYRHCDRWDWHHHARWCRHWSW